jgi:hypothetical protein
VAILPVGVQTQDSIVGDFRGAWLRPDPASVPASEALLSLNCEYNPGEVMTRNGFGLLWNPNKVITSLFNWIKAPDGVSTAGNYLVLYNATDGAVEWVANLSSPSRFPLFSVTAEAVAPASNGNQLFLPTFNSAGSGAAQMQIAGIYSLFTIAVDVAFQGPIVGKPTLANAGTGTVTAGSHFVGYVMTTRTGFTGPICPVVSGTSTPDQTSSIVAPGGETITGVISGVTFPPDVDEIQIVMTATTNAFQYFLVPGQTYGVSGATTVNFTIDIDDVTLIADATDVTNNQFFLTQDSSGNGPFSPFMCIIYGQRSVYLTLNAENLPVFYASEPNNAQQLTQQFHEVFLPGFQAITSGFVFQSVLYVLGPHWTYAFQDTGGQPVTWPTPALVDAKIGAACVFGTLVGSSGEWVAVVHITGLYIFNGNYADNPLTFMVDSDWRRINWAAAQTIRMSDNKDIKEIVVAVPLDGATTPSHLMMFDYADGLDYTTIRYSLWNIQGGFEPRGLCVCQNNSTSRQEFLLSDATAGPVLRQMNETDDASTWPNDWEPGASPNQAGISFQWECAPQPDGSAGTVMAHVGAYTRLTGVGQPVITSYGLDRTVAKQWTKPIQLSVNPGVEYWRQFYITSERCSIRFVSGVNPGDWMKVSALRERYYPWAVRR